MNKVKIGDFLYRIKRPIVLNPNDEYKLVTIKMHHKGVILRGLKKGFDIKSKMYEVKEGDFILSGIDARNGAFGIVSSELDGAIVTNDFWYFSLNEEIIDKYFFLELTSTSWFDEICRLGSDGTTQRIRLQKNKFFKQEINLPPLNEQQNFISAFIKSKTINNKIEKEINTQQTLLKKLRQSILQEAIEGKLTTSWREQNPDVESASILLEKIKQEKEQLVKDKKIKKQKSLPLINEDEIPFDIPDSWEWCKLSELINLKSGNVYKYKTVNTGIPYIKVGDMNLGENLYSVEESSTYFEKDGIKETDVIPKNSIIFPKRGGAIATNKKKKVLTKKILIDSNTMAIIVPESLNFEYLYNWFVSIDLSTLGNESVVPQVNNKDIEPLILSLPPLQEQKEVVKKIENLFKICDELETQINSSKTNSQTLMKAVLKEAFESQ